MKAMILAAGLGTRLKPWTDKHPKALARINGRTLLEHQILYLQRYGIFDIVVNVHHFADQIRHAITENDGWGSKVEVSHEVEEALETGGGLKKAAPLLQGSPEIILMNVDILTDLDLQKLIHYHRKKNGIATLAVSNRQTSRYFLFDIEFRLSGWENKNTGIRKIVRNIPDLQEKAFSGIQVMKSEIFKLLPAKEAFSMVDVYLSIAACHPVFGFDHSGGIFLDVGKPESLEKAQRIAAEL